MIILSGIHSGADPIIDVLTDRWRYWCPIRLIITIQWWRACWYSSVFSKIIKTIPAVVGRRLFIYSADWYSIFWNSLMTIRYLLFSLPIPHSTYSIVILMTGDIDRQPRRLILQYYCAIVPCWWMTVWYSDGRWQCIVSRLQAVLMTKNSQLYSMSNLIEEAWLIHYSTIRIDIGE